MSLKLESQGTGSSALMMRMCFRSVRAGFGGATLKAYRYGHNSKLHQFTLSSRLCLARIGRFEQ